MNTYVVYVLKHCKKRHKFNYSIIIIHKKRLIVNSIKCVMVVIKRISCHKKEEKKTRNIYI